jgi:uncharacterized protein YsxB (DUF464 family)
VVKVVLKRSNARIASAELREESEDTGCGQDAAVLADHVGCAGVSVLVTCPLLL